MSAEYELRNLVEKEYENGEDDLSQHPNRAFRRYNSANNPRCTVQGTHSYDVLANPNYFDDFVYIPVYQQLDYDATPQYGNDDMKDRRSLFIIDADSDEENDEWVCDKVRVGLNLAYLHEKAAMSFVFNGKEL